MLVYLVPVHQRYKKSNYKFLLTWPGIDDINFHKFVPKAIPTSKGHTKGDGLRRFDWTISIQVK